MAIRALRRICRFYGLVDGQYFHTVGIEMMRSGRQTKIKLNFLFGSPQLSACPTLMTHEIHNKRQ